MKRGASRRGPTLPLLHCHQGEALVLGPEDTFGAEGRGVLPLEFSLFEH